MFEVFLNESLKRNKEPHACLATVWGLGSPRQSKARDSRFGASDLAILTT